jgi:hypothetical protein
MGLNEFGSPRLRRGEWFGQPRRRRVYRRARAEARGGATCEVSACSICDWCRNDPPQIASHPAPPRRSRGFSKSSGRSRSRAANCAAVSAPARAKHQHDGRRPRALPLLILRRSVRPSIFDRVQDRVGEPWPSVGQCSSPSNAAPQLHRSGPSDSSAPVRVFVGVPSRARAAANQSARLVTALS